MRKKGVDPYFNQMKNTKMKNIILEIAERIKKGCQPEKIILFGSCLRENSHRDSDIDLLVIKESSQRRDERDREIRELLKEIKVPLDIFVYTPEEVKRFSAFKGSFINEIFNSGEVLYEQ